MTEPLSSPQSKKCAFIALVGAPNAGKSTLLNRLIGSKISIVSPKVQTTRNVITGICIEGDAQLVFFDTPGIFTPDTSHRLEKAMVSAAWNQMDEGDMLCLLVDAPRANSENTKLIIQALKDKHKKAILVLNKIDLIDKAKLLELASQFHAEGVFTDIFMVSATTGDGVSDLRKFLAKNAPISPWMYPEDQLSTAPQRFIASEITREKLFIFLHKELPYHLTVVTDQYEERPKDVKIYQTIYVTKESHKKIVLGQKGQLIKQIGEKSRKDLEAIIGCKVHLFLFVKVRENWLENPEFYHYMGLEKPEK